MGKASKQEAPARAGATGVSFQLIRELAARIQQYALNHDITDVDELVDYLKRTNPGYKRRPQAQFRKVVERALLTVQKEGGIQKPELQLQAIEEQHIAKRGPGADREGVRAVDTVLAGDESDSEAELEQGESNKFEDELTSASGVGLNSTLANLYSTPKSSQMQKDTPSTKAVQDGDGPAFASPHVVAAAAARALAAQREASRQPSQHPSSQGADDGLQLPVATALPASRKSIGAPAEAGLSEPHAISNTPSQKDKTQKPTSSRSQGKRPRESDPRASSSIAQPKAVRFADLGGIDSILKDILELVQWPLLHPEIYSWLGVEPPRGVLLHGPPGCGKTALANAIANECGVPFLRIAAPEVVSGMSGESEAKIRQLFQEAAVLAPCIIFIDEIDAIAGKRESAQREMERRIVAQMLTCMDDLASPRPAKRTKPNDAVPAVTADRHVLVIGATNRPDSLDTALRRAGRFDREIAMGIPNREARARILQVIVQKLRLSGDFDFQAVASRTPGFVGADLQALTKEAAAIAIARIFQSLPKLSIPADNLGEPAVGALVDPMKSGPMSEEELAGLAITMSDFEAAIQKVQPSVRREGFATTPDVTWDDVGALQEVREELAFAVTHPIQHPEQFAAMGLGAPSGVLLFGPPGCGKTLLAKAVANESGANFISIKGPELLNKFVGESERAVRQVFARARAAAPCVLFFDEMDALAPRRGSDSNSSSERVVNQLLTEMDGIDGRQGVYMIAATNRPDIIDRALLRPGRLDKMLYIPLPTAAERAEIVAALARSKPLSQGVDVQGIARDYCQGFSGADLSALVREAATNALKESMRQTASMVARLSTPCIEGRHFQIALERIKPSVNPKDVRIYDSMRSRLPSARGHIERDAGGHFGPSHPEASEAVLSPPGSAADMDRSEGDATAGNEPMDE